MDIDFLQMIPRALRMDKNAYALAKAISAQLLYLDEGIQAMLDGLTLQDNAEEYILDEIAWERDAVLYEMDMTQREKLRAIIVSDTLKAKAGTVGAIRDAIRVISPTCTLLEEGGFRGVILPGEEDSESTAIRALRAAIKVCALRTHLRVGVYEGEGTLPDARVMSVAGSTMR